ncbi:hypothetical protein Trydic_g14107 [Trypoxylus dichotomus]
MKSPHRYYNHHHRSLVLRRRSVKPGTIGFLPKSIKQFCEPIVIASVCYAGCISAFRAERERATTMIAILDAETERDGTTRRRLSPFAPLSIEETVVARQTQTFTKRWLLSNP